MYMLCFHYFVMSISDWGGSMGGMSVLYNKNNIYHIV